MENETQYLCKERHREDITDRVIEAAVKQGVFQLQAEGAGEPRILVVECSKGHLNTVTVWG